MKRKKMTSYGGYFNKCGIAQMLKDFSTVLDESVARMNAIEDVEDSRLGVGFGFIGYSDGAFIMKRGE